MELASYLLRRTVFNTRPKKEVQILVFLDKYFHEQHLSQTLPTKNNHFKITVTFIVGYTGQFNVTDLKIDFYLHSINYWWRFQWKCPSSRSIRNRILQQWNETNFQWRRLFYRKELFFYNQTNVFNTRSYHKVQNQFPSEDLRLFYTMTKAK